MKRLCLFAGRASVLSVVLLSGCGCGTRCGRWVVRRLCLTHCWVSEGSGAGLVQGGDLVCLRRGWFLCLLGAPLVCWVVVLVGWLFVNWIVDASILRTALHQALSWQLFAACVHGAGAYSQGWGLGPGLVWVGVVVSLCSFC